MADFQFFEKSYGAPSWSKSVDIDKLRRFQKVVPSAVVDFWQRFGFSSFANGLVSVGDPDLFKQPLLDLYPSGTDLSSIPIAHTGFGNVLYWTSGQYRYLNVHLFDHVDCGDDTETVFNFFLVDAKSRAVLFDEALFQKATKKFGQIGELDMFGFKLPLSMGGTHGMANIAKMKIPEQWSIIGEFHR
jgi:hypothetical protein